MYKNWLQPTGSYINWLQPTGNYSNIAIQQTKNNYSVNSNQKLVFSLNRNRSNKYNPMINDYVMSIQTILKNVVILTKLYETSN